jgi:hypothetical protein
MADSASLLALFIAISLTGWCNSQLAACESLVLYQGMRLLVPIKSAQIKEINQRGTQGVPRRAGRFHKPSYKDNSELTLSSGLPTIRV